MTLKIRTVTVQKDLYGVFFSKSEQFLNAAKSSFEAGDYNALAANSAHACISAADALCTKHLGKRAAGDKHSDAVNLVKSIKDTDEFLSNAAKFNRVLAVKSLAEYEARLVYKTDSESVLHNAEKFHDFVKRNL